MSGSATRRFAGRCALWAFLACSLLGALAPAQGLVLCVESEGSVSIESAFGPECCGARTDAAQRDATSDAARAEPERPCCPCIDVPLANVSDQRRSPHRSGHATPDDAVARAAGCAAVALETPAEGRRLQRPFAPRAPASLVLERSVVLVV